MEDEKIEITWYVEDGYAGKDRPQHLYVRLSDFEFCSSQREVDDILAEMLDDALKERASWGCPRAEEYIAELFDKATKYREENATHVDT